MLVTLQQPSRHTLHVKHNCTETPRESGRGEVKGGGGGGGGGGEGEGERKRG